VTVAAKQEELGAGVHYLRKEGVEEIALSVLSEIVLHRRSGSGEPMRDRL